MAEPIVTVEDLTAYQDGSPQAILDAATAAVRRYCGWHITPVQVERIRLPVDGGSTIVLPSLHVTAVTSIVYAGTALDPADYTWSPVGVIDVSPFGPYFAALRLYWVNRYWPTSGDVEVTFTHGFDLAPDVAAVILSMTARAAVSPDGVTRTQVGAVSQSYSATGVNTAGGIAFLPNETAVLDRYRLAPRP